MIDFSQFLKLFSYKTKVHPIRMFAIVLFAYSRGLSSTRVIEQACFKNLRFRFILQDSPVPNHSTIFRFLLKTQHLLSDLFEQFFKKILEFENISSDTIFIDGTKIEAYANRYSFIWKKSTQKYNNRLLLNIQNLIQDFNLQFSKNFSTLEQIYQYLSTLNINFVYGQGHKKSIEQKYFEQCEKFLERYNKYQNYLDILKNRNSFSKTDNDATFMRMKEDYMRNGQLKPAYNLQLRVISEYICAYDIYPNPTDTKTLIPFLEKIKKMNIDIKNIVADAGYESFINYNFLDKNNYEAYIKPIYYKKSKTRKFKSDLNRVENLIYDEEKIY